DLLRQLRRQGGKNERQHHGLDAEALGNVEQRLDEEMSTAHHRAEADQQLQYAEGESWVFTPLGAALEDQRVERLLVLHLSPGTQRASDIDRIGEENEDPDRDPQRVGRTPAQGQGEGKEDQEEDQVALEGWLVSLQLQPLLAPLAVQVGEEADEAHCQGGEQEGGADDRPNRHLITA